MKTTKSLFLAMVFIAFLFSCEEDKVVPIPDTQSNSEILVQGTYTLKSIETITGNDYEYNHVYIKAQMEGEGDLNLMGSTKIKLSHTIVKETIGGRTYYKNGRILIGNKERNLIGTYNTIVTVTDERDLITPDTDIIINSDFDPSEYIKENGRSGFPGKKKLKTYENSHQFNIAIHGGNGDFKDVTGKLYIELKPKNINEYSAKIKGKIYNRKGA